MSPLESPWPHTHHELIQHYYDQYDQLIASGEYEPFLLPWGMLGGFVIVLYLLIPHQHRGWLKNLRFAAFAWMLGFAAYTIRNTLSKGMALGMGFGLTSAWGAIWVLAIIVCSDAQTDFQRIERTEGLFKMSSHVKDTQDVNIGPAQVEEKKLNITPNGNSNSNGHINPKEHLGPSKRHGEFAWQAYPLTPFIERVDWVLDLFCNYRGAGWSWRTSSLPPPPKAIQEELRRNSPHPPRHSNAVRPGQPHVYSTRKEMLIANAKTFVVGYLMLDALKTVMMHDPYFWGIMDRPPPSWLPHTLANSPVFLSAYRSTLSMLGVQWALKTIFSMGPLFFSGVLGPSLIGARAEPWMYPEIWGPFSIVLDRGLAGWWSAWWHQSFRFAFEQPGRKLVGMLNMDPKAPGAILLKLIIAFALSGSLHASGSYMSIAESKPLRGSMVFFLLQPFAIFVEITLTSILRKSGVQRHVPRWAMRLFTFVYVHVWFYYTAPLVCEDFARIGCWLFEPAPVSLFRAIGLGADGYELWCWVGMPVRWYSDPQGRWWKSGLAL